MLGGALGGPLGAALGAGLFKTADNKAHGDSWGHAIGQGALNAGGAYLGSGGISQLKNAFGGGGFVPGSAPLAGVSGVPSAGGPWQAAASAAGGGGGSGGSSLLSGIGSAAKGVGSFVAEHPNAVGQGLQGLGQISQQGGMNDLRRAQTDQINQETATSKAALDAQKQRAASLMALFQAFGAQNPGGIGAMPQAPAYMTPNFTGR